MAGLLMHLPCIYDIYESTPTSVKFRNEMKRCNLCRRKSSFGGGDDIVLSFSIALCIEQRRMETNCCASTYVQVHASLHKGTLKVSDALDVKDVARFDLPWAFSVASTPRRQKRGTAHRTRQATRYATMCNDGRHM